MKQSLWISALFGAALITAAPVRGDHAAATIVVRMVGDEKGFRFVPASVTARVGDVVRFVNVSGGPHNVAFSADRIPAGAAARLQKNMGQTNGPLSGAMIFESNEVYTVSLAGLPAGTYNYYCVPHQAMNMTGRIRVRAR
ncbi:MAG: plastocyanin/azurin family copper-binding protein [Gemmatimonadaceae bacterium]